MIKLAVIQHKQLTANHFNKLIIDLFSRDVRITPLWEGKGEASEISNVNPPEVTGSGMWLYVEPLSGMYTHARHTNPPPSIPPRGED